jgi:hypothetical protein
VLEESNIILTEQLAKLQNENIDLKIELEKTTNEKTKSEADYKNKVDVKIFYNENFIYENNYFLYQINSK